MRALLSTGRCTPCRTGSGSSFCVLRFRGRSCVFHCRGLCLSRTLACRGLHRGPFCTSAASASCNSAPTSSTTGATSRSGPGCSRPGDTDGGGESDQAAIHGAAPTKFVSATPKETVRQNVRRRRGGGLQRRKHAVTRRGIAATFTAFGRESCGIYATQWAREPSAFASGSASAEQKPKCKCLRHPSAYSQRPPLNRPTSRISSCIEWRYESMPWL